MHYTHILATACSAKQAACRNVLHIMKAVMQCAPIACGAELPHAACCIFTCLLISQTCVSTGHSFRPKQNNITPAHTMHGGKEPVTSSAESDAKGSEENAQDVAHTPKAHSTTNSSWNGQAATCKLYYRYCLGRLGCCFKLCMKTCATTAAPNSCCQAHCQSQAKLLSPILFSYCTYSEAQTFCYSTCSAHSHAMLFGPTPLYLPSSVLMSSQGSCLTCSRLSSPRSASSDSRMACRRTG